MAVDMDKLNVFLGKFVRDLEATVHSRMMMIGEKLGLHTVPTKSPSEPGRAGMSGTDVGQCTPTHSDTRASGNCVTGWRNRSQIFVPRRRVIAAVVLSWVLFAPNRSYSEHMPNDDDPVALELSTLGEKGDTIARARRQALEILQNGNACTAWFQEADPAAAEVFRSLHLGLEIKGPSYIYASKDNGGVQLFKHPWAAMAMEYGGRNSIVLLNANGAFFKRASIVMQLDTEGMPSRVAGMRELVIASYDGNTPEAQITILLHELGHITGRLPEDGDSWDGRSSRNTSELLQHCKAEIFAVSRNSLRGQARGTISTSKPKQENWP